VLSLEWATLAQIFDGAVLVIFPFRNLFSSAEGSITEWVDYFAVNSCIWRTIDLNCGAQSIEIFCIFALPVDRPTLKMAC
jgi:hypothetical protein